MYLINQKNMRVQHNKSQDKQNFPFWAPEMAAKILEFADRCGVLLLLSNLFGCTNFYRLLRWKCRSFVDIQKKDFSNNVGIPLINGDLEMTVFVSKKPGRPKNK